MFEIGMYFYVFYCLCYVKDISTYMLEEQVSEERDIDLNSEDYTRMEDSKEDHWRDVIEDGEDKSDISALRWYVYTIEKEEFIKIFFKCALHIQKGKHCLDLCEG